MKKILISILLVFFTATSFSLNVSNGDLVTIGSTSPTSIFVTNASTKGGDYTTFTITVVSGTLKVGNNSISANAYAWPVSSKIIITCANGNLFVQAGSNTDTFAITTN